MKRKQATNRCLLAAFSATLALLLLVSPMLLFAQPPAEQSSTVQESVPLPDTTSVYVEEESGASGLEQSSEPETSLPEPEQPATKGADGPVAFAPFSIVTSQQQLEDAIALIAADSGKSGSITISGTISLNRAMAIAPGVEVTLVGGILEAGSSRHFVVEGTLVLDGTELNGGGTAGGVDVEAGGRLAIKSGSAINNCRVDPGHSALHPDARGGAVAVYGGALHIDGGSFMGNLAYAANHEEALGGAVYLENADFAIGNAQFEENEAGIGGAIYANATALAVYGTSFESNSAAYASAVYIGAQAVGGLLFDGCRFEANICSLDEDFLGGAIYSCSDTQLVLKDSTFTKNHAYYGGGVTITRNASLHVENGSFTDNVARARGGAIFTRDTETYSNLTTDGIAFSGNVGFDGQLIYPIKWPGGNPEPIRDMHGTNMLGITSLSSPFSINDAYSRCLAYNNYDVGGYGTHDEFVWAVITTVPLYLDGEYIGFRIYDYDWWIVRPTPEVPAGYELDGWYRNPDYTDRHDFSIRKTMTNMPDIMPLYARSYIPVPDGTTPIITKEAAYAPANKEYKLGVQVTFHIKVTNPSDTNVINVTVKDVLSPNLTYTTSINGQWSSSTRTITWTRALQPGETVTFQIVCRSAIAGVVTNTATVESDMGGKASASETIYILPDGYQLTFRLYTDLPHADDPATQWVKAGEKATAPAEPLREGYEIVGWYQDAQFNDPAALWDFGTTTMPANAVTLYALWSPLLFDIEYHWNDGSGDMFSDQIPCGDAVPYLSRTRTGYTLKGWTYEDGGVATPWDFVSGKMPARKLVLLAVWEKDTVPPPTSSSSSGSSSSGGGTPPPVSSSQPSSTSRGGASSSTSRRQSSSSAPGALISSVTSAPLSSSTVATPAPGPESPLDEELATLYLFGIRVPVGSLLEGEGWSLLNLLLALVALVSALLRAIFAILDRRRAKYEDMGDLEYTGTGQKRLPRWVPAALVYLTGLLPLLCFAVLENFHHMVLLSRFTPLIVCLLALHLALRVLLRRTRAGHSRD